MSPLHDRELSDAEFERLLLESADFDSQDRTGRSTEEAWSSLCAALAPLQAGAQHERPPQLTAAAPVSSFSLWQAAGWMLLGGIGGGIATALWLGAFATPLSVPAPAEPTHSDGVEALAPVSAPPPTLSAPPTAAVPTPHEPTLRAKPATRPGVEVKARAPERSSLAAEVAAVDRARTLFRAGRHADALHAVGQYQRDFPRGALARDADVVAIEALAGLHDRSELEQRARRFLERYPQDPHAARVRSLVPVR